MKRFLILVMLIFMAIGIYAGGEQENEALILGVNQGDHEVEYSADGEFLGKESGVYYWRDIVLKDYPEEVVIRGYSTDNTTTKLDVDIAGGDPPNVYHDYLGRVNKYANSKFALPIDLGAEAEEFIPSYLDLLTKDGVLYGIPETAWAAVMIVNKPLLESAGAGYLLPADDDPDRSWTTDAFIKATQMVQKKYGKDYYGYVLFSASTGGDYWSSFGWIAGYGAKLYDNGKIVIDSEAGISALKFMLEMQDTGIAMPGAAGLTYAENLSAMINNNIVAMGGTVNHGDKPIELANGSGTIQAVIMEYPHIVGVDHVPVTVGPDAGMIFKSGNAKLDARSLDLLKYITSEKVQKYLAKYNSRFASRKNALQSAESKAWNTVNNMIAESGVFDMGLGLEHYSEVRELWPPTLQAIFSHELTVEQAVERFVTEGNEILK